MFDKYQEKHKSMKRHMLKLFIPTIKDNLLPPEVKILQRLGHFPIRNQPRHQHNPRNDRKQDNYSSHIFQDSITSKYDRVEDESGEYIEIDVGQVEENRDDEVDDDVDDTLVSVVAQEEDIEEAQIAEYVEEAESVAQDEDLDDERDNSKHKYKLQPRRVLPPLHPNQTHHPLLHNHLRLHLYFLMHTNSHNQHLELSLKTPSIPLQLSNLRPQLPHAHPYSITLRLYVLLVVLVLAVDVVQLLGQLLLFLQQLLEGLMLLGDALGAADQTQLALQLGEGVEQHLADVLDFGCAVGQQLQVAPQLVEKLAVEMALFAQLVQIVH